MFIQGAAINFHEHHHKDKLLSIRIYMQSFMNWNTTSYSPTKKSSFENKRTNNSNNLNHSTTINSRNSNNSNGNNSNSTRLSYTAMTPEMNTQPTINPNYILFEKALCSDEFQDESVLIKNTAGCIKVISTLCQKIHLDHVIRPLKIFWVKADYAIVGQIVVIIFTGLSVILSNISKSIEFPQLLTNAS
jgi:hypothetical protein